MTTLSKASQLVLRNLDDIQGDNLLVMNAPPDPLALVLQQSLPDTQIRVFQHDYADHQYLRAAYEAAGFDVDGLVFGPIYPPAELRPKGLPREGEAGFLGETRLLWAEGLHDVALVFLPKSRILTEMTLRMVAQTLQPHARVLLVGENAAGIRSSRSLLEQIVGPVTRSAAARHCTLLQAKQVRPGSPLGSPGARHLFT